MKYLISIILFFSLLYLTSFSGSIKPVLLPTGPDDTVVVQTIPFSIRCTQTATGFYVIKNQTQYDDLILNRRSPHPDCGNYTLPPFDFNTYTLIGVVRSSSGAGKDTLYVLKTSNVITVYHIIYRYSDSKILHDYEHWFLIKNEPKYEIKNEFKINQL